MPRCRHCELMGFFCAKSVAKNQHERSALYDAGGTVYLFIYSSDDFETASCADLLCIDLLQLFCCPVAVILVLSAHATGEQRQH